MIILGENTYFDAGYKANANNIVIGAPGTGKSRSFVIPNLCEAKDESLVVLDAKGEVYDITSEMMRKKGYSVQVLDFDEPQNSQIYYNPLHYCNNEDDIIKLADLLTQDQRQKNNDAFWHLSAKMLCNALVAFLVFHCSESKRNLTSLMKLLKMARVTDVQNNRSRLDDAFDDLERTDPTSWAVTQYHLLKTAAERTQKSVVISLIAEFCGLLTPSVSALTSKNTLDIAKLSEERVILYVKCSDIDRSKDKLVSIFFMQLFSQLFGIADKAKSHATSRPIHIILDDMGSNLKIPRLDCIISCCRGRNISLSLILQSFGQLKKNYVDYTSILNSCNNIMFLGGNDLETCREISYRVNRPLEEVLYKDKDTLFVFSQGSNKPIVTRIYPLKSHPNYELLNDNWVDAEENSNENELI